MKRAIGFIAAGLLILCISGSNQAQSAQTASGGTNFLISASPDGQFHALNAYMSILSKRMETLRLREMNADRQKHLESETNQLVDLATDLDRDMRGGKELTPLDLRKRAAEIERLAHSVQERMKG